MHWTNIFDDYEVFEAARKAYDYDPSISVYPSEEDLLKAFRLTEFSDVKVVILGQDPYHGKGQANGLAFSVGRDKFLPPSLKNIFKELKADLNVPMASHGDLTSWAKQGVLLLNTVLTVEEGKPGSHYNIGWEPITDSVIRSLSAHREGLIFILWGKKAQQKKSLIDPNRHFIIESPHPSPYSANSGFFGSKPFSKTNNILKSLGKDEINWQIE